LTAGDVRRRLRLRADELGLDFQQAIQYYAMERFLFRLSQSAWSDRFIVKGALMLRVWDAAVARPTRDIDFLGRIENTPEAVREAVHECLAVAVADDGLEFSEEIEVTQAMLDDRYPGLRVKIRGDLAGARFTMRLDIGVDDAVVPAPGWVDYPPLLDAPAPRILAYDPATAVAEKSESIVELGLINSRLKDFYDLWMLAGTLSFDGQGLADALSATFRTRGTELPKETPVALTITFGRAERHQCHVAIVPLPPHYGRNRRAERLGRRGSRDRRVHHAALARRGEPSALRSNLDPRTRLASGIGRMPAVEVRPRDRHLFPSSKLAPLPTRLT
jgi:hypothetical protein